MVQFDEEFISGEQQKIEQAYTEIGRIFYENNRECSDDAYSEPYTKIRAAEKAIDDHRRYVLKQNGLIICKHCGMEIVDISRFCNFCGKPVEAEPEPEMKATGGVTEAIPALSEEQPGENDSEATDVSSFDDIINSFDSAPSGGNPADGGIDFSSLDSLLSGFDETPAETQAPDTAPSITPEPAPKPAPEPAPDTAVAGGDPDITAALETFAAPTERRCKKCGAVVGDDFDFCTNCGTRLEPLNVPGTGTYTCRLCGTPLAPDTVFCVNCGTKRDDAAPASKMKKCPKCGFTTDDSEVMFCYECGTRMV